MAYVYLAIAIVTEVIATTSLKASDSFTKLWPSLIVVAGYAVSFYLLTICVQTLKVGMVYAVWSGVGIVLVTLAGWLIYQQRIDTAGLVGLGLIVAGAVVLNVFSTMELH